jgi:hypothetical protein
MKFKHISLLAISGILVSCSHNPHLATETQVKDSALNRVVAQDATNSDKKFDFNLVCGDTNEAYVDMDLSDYFKETYLTDRKKNEYQNEGFEYFFAGRNCGLGSWQGETYSVLFLFEDKKSREIFDFGPFSLFTAEINLRLGEEKFNQDPNAGKIMKADLILTSEKDLHGKRVLSGEDGAITGVMTSDRGFGKVKIVISPR